MGPPAWERKQMKVCNRHERFVAATPERVAALVEDFERIWPVQIAPVPRLQGNRLDKAGMMVWGEVDRPGAARVFGVISRGGFQVEHWFEVEPVGDGSLLRHTVKGEAVGEFEAIWREQAEPMHDLFLEALLDNITVAVACG